MKRKIFIGLFPVLLALSACGGIAPNTDKQETFLEDTLLHEEIFGSLEEPNSPIKSIRNLDPVDPAAPKIGVQYALEGGLYSVRYVAAFAFPTTPETLANYTATWTRSAYDVEGNKINFAEPTVNCTKLYPAIVDGDSSLNAASFSADSTYFVVYTLRKIPSAQVGGCLLASLTIDDGEGGISPVTSNTIATTFDTALNAVRTSFTTEDLAVDGYFLKGSHGRTDADNPKKGEETNLASFSPTLNAETTFLVIKNDLTNNKFKMLGSSCLSPDDGTGNYFENTNGKIKAKYSHDYTLYLSSASKLSLRYLNVETTGFVGTGNYGYCWTWNEENLATTSRWVKIENNMIPLRENDDRVIPCETTATPDSSTTWDSGSHVNNQGAANYIIEAENGLSLYFAGANVFTWDNTNIPAADGFTLVVNGKDLYPTVYSAANEVKATITLGTGDEVSILERKNSGANYYHYSKGFEDGVTGFTWSNDKLYVNASGTYTFYLKNTNQDSKIFWIDPVRYIIVAKGGDWTNVQKTELTYNNDNEYKVLNFSLEKDDVFYFSMCYGVYKSFDDLKEGGAYTHFVVNATSSDLKVVDTGNYDFYVKITADQDGSIWSEVSSS